MCQSDLTGYTVTELNFEVIEIKEPEMSNNAHIIRICSVASGALSIICIILLMYGAWLYDNGLATKLQVILTCSIPAAMSAITLLVGAYHADNHR